MGEVRSERLETRIKNPAGESDIHRRRPVRHHPFFRSDPELARGAERDRGFADSPVEGDGFEPSVPLAKEARAQAWNSSIEVTRPLLRA
jgi:hypothetical protein